MQFRHHDPVRESPPTQHIPRAPPAHTLIHLRHLSVQCRTPSENSLGIGQKPGSFQVGLNWEIR